MTALERARAARGKVEAARMREDFLTDLGMNLSMPVERAGDLNAGVDELERAFPQIADLEVGEAEDFAAGLSARRARGGGGKAIASKRGRGPTLGERRERVAGQRAGRGSPAGGRSRATRARASARRRPGTRARRAFRDTGIPSAARSTTQLALQAIGLLVGGSLVYLLLSNAESPGRGGFAIAQIGEAATQAVRRLVAPRDPLERVGGSGVASSAGGAKLTPGEAGRLAGGTSSISDPWHYWRGSLGGRSSSGRSAQRLAHRASSINALLHP